ncbi:Tetratricopeptide repeat protein 28 [Exaiptasia diaphana]|nr:Tetratricopeptide repeat protein 28 [Exaiptasia diaphana]
MQIKVDGHEQQGLDNQNNIGGEVLHSVLPKNILNESIVKSLANIMQRTLVIVTVDEKDKRKSIKKYEPNETTSNRSLYIGRYGSHYLALKPTMVNNIPSERVCNERQEKCSFSTPDSVRLSESARVKANHLIVQCRGYIQLKKHTAAIKKGKECIEIADQLNQPDQDLIKMEAAREVWRAYEILHQDDNAIIYQAMYDDFAQQYANSLSEDDQDNKDWSQSTNQQLNNLTNHLIGSFMIEKMKACECAKKGNYQAAILHNARAAEYIKGENKQLLMKTFRDLIDLHGALSQYHKAIQYAEKIIEVARDSDDKKWESIGYLMKGQIHCCLGDYEYNSLLALKAALRISRENNDNEMADLVSFVLKKEKGFHFYNRNNKKATMMIVHPEKAVENKFTTLETLRYWYNFHSALHQHTKAMHYAVNIIEVAKGSNDKKWESTGRMMMAHNYSCFCVGDYNSSLLAFDEALRNCNETYDIKGANIASLLIEKVRELNKLKQASNLHREHFEAIQYAETTIEVAINRNDKKLEFTGYMMKGQVHCCLLCDYDSSLLAFTEALRILEETNDNEGANHATFWIERVRALKFVLKNDKQAAIIHFKEAVGFFRGDDKSLLLETLHDLFRLHYALHQHPEAIQYAEQIIEVAKNSNDKKWGSIGYMRKGQDYSCFCVRDYDSSFLAFTEALRILEETNDNEGANHATFWIERGQDYSCFCVRDYDSSFLAFTEALRILEETNDNEGANHATFWIERVRALKFVLKNDKQAAIIHFKEAVGFFRGDDKSLLLETLHDLFRLHYALHQHPEAIQYAEQIIEVAKNSNDKKWESIGYMRKGQDYSCFCVRDYDSSFLAFTEALRILEETNDNEGANHATFWIERVRALKFVLKNDKQAAIIHFKEAVGFFRGDDKSLLLETLHDLVNLHCALHQHPEAIQYAEQIIEVAKNSNDKKWESDGYLMKGQDYSCFCVRDYDSSLLAFTGALRIFKESNDSKGANDASFWIERVRALNVVLKNDKQAVISHTEKALKTVGDKYLLMEFLYEFVALHLQIYQHPEVYVIEYAKKLIEEAKVIQDKKWECRGYFMKSNVYSRLCEHDSSLLALKEASRIAKENNDIETINTASFRIEKINALQCAVNEDIESAIMHSERAVEYSQDQGKSSLIDPFRELIFSYKYTEALQLAESILRLARDDINYERWEFNGYLLKGIVLINLGDHVSALSALDEALRISKKCNALESDLGEVYLHQAVSNFSLGDFETAKKCFGSYFGSSHQDIRTFIEEIMETTQFTLDDEFDHNITEQFITEFERTFNTLHIEMIARFKVYHNCLIEICQKQPLLSTLIFFNTLNFLTKLENHFGEIFFKNTWKPAMQLCFQLPGIMSLKQAADITTRILQDQKQELLSPQQSAALSSVSFIVNYLDGKFEMCEKIQKLSLEILENAVSRIAVEDHKITLCEQYVIMYKLLFKVLVKMEREKEALWVAERCRAKELKFRLLHREIEERDINYSHIESYMLDMKCAIIFYIWCFEDLFIYSIQKGKDDQGKDTAVVKMFSQKNCKTQLDSLIRRVWSQISGCSMQQQPSISRTAVNEDDEHSMVRAGPPSENDCHNFQNTDPGEDSVENPYGELYELLIQPVGDIAADKLVIIPEGSLYLLPFQALQNSTTKRYLSQDKKLRFSPSMTTLLSHQSFPKDYYARSGSLIIGNPNVDQIEGMEPLPGAQKEAEAIARIIDGVMPLIGPRATKSAVLERLFEVCIAHFACHIKLNPSAIVLSPEGSPQHGDDDDSYLIKPEDIMEKDIHARLVVLSGCDGARGKICAEGVVGIARAFLAAGASAVLVSLWRVGDFSTYEFMTIFYTNFLDWDVRRSASESLHLTINYMRAKYPHEPMKWSGFYLMGDDVTIDRESLSVLREPPVSRRREPCECDE